MDCRRVVFSRHAVQRMFDRSVSEPDVTDTLKDGETIEEYPGDTPYPSCLLLGRSGSRPLHVVATRDPESGLCVVVTVYIPDTTQWSGDFRMKITR